MPDLPPTAVPFALDMDSIVFDCQLHPSPDSPSGLLIFDPTVPQQMRGAVLLALEQEGIFATLGLEPGKTLKTWDLRGSVLSLRSAEAAGA